MTLSRKLAKLIIEKGVSVDDLISTLHKYNLLGLLPSIISVLKQSAIRSNASDTIMIESPFPLSDEAISHIKKIIGNSNSPYETTVNKNILAGFKARYKGKLYDGSAERITRQLIANR
ncbi:MAG: F0F1 ATP synthase subunit delta [Candidatus Pacebacteria bacterium]|nr:F0F1 ATP synthase subunit delta [Candidatus Paceibacterota bacterium]